MTMHMIAQALRRTSAGIFGTFLFVTHAHASVITSVVIHAPGHFAEDFDVHEVEATSQQSIDVIEPTETKTFVTAHANTATGKLGGTITTTVVSGQTNAVSEANLSETLYFDVAGAGDATITPITFLFSLHGTQEVGATSEGSATMQLSIQLMQNGDTAGLSTHVATSIDTVGHSFNTHGWAAEKFLGDHQPTAFDYLVTYELHGANPIVDFAMAMDLWSLDETYALFHDAASVNLLLPKHVSFTSSSGAFLSQAPPLTVAEPATLGLLMLAMLGMRRGTRKARLWHRFAAPM